MSYSDLELKNCTQVAYADLGTALNYLKATDPGKSSYSIAELEKVAKLFGSDVGSLSCLTADQKKNWRISCVHDTNDENGFYACVIETSPGKAVVAFRGSESMSDPSNLVNDWIKSDFGLLNSTETSQHSEVRRFLSQRGNELNRYGELTMTGHSLGGNLAEYATIVSSEYGLDDNIDHCYSFDGPGFSDEFIARYGGQIVQMSSKMTHYRWSLVGGLLFDLPGVTYVTCNVKNTENDTYGPFTRHDTKFLDLDKDGNIVEGTRDPLSWVLYGLSKGVELNAFNYLLLSFVMFRSGFASIREFCENLFVTANSFYKTIHDAVKNFFHRNEAFFRVNTVSLRSDADNIAGAIARVKKSVSEMFDSVQSLNGMWKGPANAAFSEKFAQERASIDAYLDRIQSYVDSVESDCRAYDKSESMAMELIASIKA